MCKLKQLMEIIKDKDSDYEQLNGKNKKLHLNLKSLKLWGILVAVVIVAIGVMTLFFKLHNDESTVTNDYVLATLEKSSELTTAKIHYTGMAEFEDEGIAIINKADFIMVYDATARIGFDIADVNPIVDNTTRTVNITIPKAEVLDVKVDASSISYFDEDFAMFNVDEKEDGNKAIELAEKAALKEISQMGTLELADQQAEAVIKGLLEDVIAKNYTLKIRKAK